LLVFAHRRPTERARIPWRPLIGTLALLALPVACKRQNAYVPPPPPHVTVAQPLSQAVTPYLEATGNTVAFNQTDLVARVEGFLQDIRYTDGASVHRGETLFVIEPAPYQAKLQQAQAALKSAQAQAVQSQAEYNRQVSLGRSDFSSRSSVDQAQAQNDTNQANVASQQAAVTLAATNLGYTQVTAPFDGVATAHEVAVGSLVGASGPTKLASVIQFNPIYVSFNVSEQDVLRIRASLKRAGLSETDLDKVPVEIGLMTETGYPHRGKLDYAAPSVDTATGTLLVRGVLDNADRALLPGFFVRVRVPMQSQKAEALLVPDTALGADQSGRYLLVVDKDDVVQQRAVTTGALVGSLRVIRSGLEAADRVVIGGLQRAVPGAKVAPQAGEIKAASLPPPGKS
jgi:RND family efflux transporter MFP subunit